MVTKYCVVLFFLTLGSVFSQEKFHRHTVITGETIASIAQKYSVNVSSIYRINPDIINGIKDKAILLIPLNSDNKTLQSPINTTINYVVLPKETLYSIAKRHNVTIDDLYRSNPELEKEGLQSGQSIKIFHASESKFKTVSGKLFDENKNKTDKASVDYVEIAAKKQTAFATRLAQSNSVIEHEVQSKETFYSIAKKYAVTVSQLQDANLAQGTKSLVIGQKICVPIQSSTNQVTAITKEKEKKIEKINDSTRADNEAHKVETIVTHKVLLGETKYAIARMYGVSIKDIERQNPRTTRALLVGSLIKIPQNSSNSGTADEELAIESDYKEVISAKDTDIFDSSSSNNLVELLISKASELIGTPYRSGGTSVDGFDCSGLICYTFSNTDIKLPRSSIEMASVGTQITTDEVKKGDLIFFKTRGMRDISHVGLVTEVVDGEIKFIHSASRGGVIISSLKEAYYQKNFAQINRVL
jgi:cell wall-associated NlpC family hydrolase